jgi:hypothetical protein
MLPFYKPCVELMPWQSAKRNWRAPSREHEKKGRVAATILRLEQTERGKMENRTDAAGKPATGSK